MYRAVALAALRLGVTFPLDERGETQVVELAQSLAIDFVPVAGLTRVRCNGEDVSDALRDPEVSRAASVVSAVPAVRRAMVARQRELGRQWGGVVEGRDIGTVVFPEAQVKVFLTARPEVRVQRRFEELRGRGMAVSWQEVEAEQRERDARDAGRADSPLRPAPGAIILDTSDLTLGQVVEKLLAAVAQRSSSLDRSPPAHL